MKILDESFSKGGSGHVRVVPDTSEDMWQLFNLLRAEDHVEAVTFRKVSRSAGADGVGPGESERIRVKLRVSVESVDYDGEGEAVASRAATRPRLNTSNSGRTTRWISMWDER
jgi:protein pelota